MIKSMTGYGKGEAAVGTGSFVVEIRSVNHRYGEISARMPRAFLSLEHEVKKTVSAFLKRGKIDLYVQWEEGGESAAMPQIDIDLAKNYATLLRDLAKELNIPEEISLETILSRKGVLRDAVIATDESEKTPHLISAVKNAVAEIDAMRRREGEILLADLTARRFLIAGLTKEIAAYAPEMAVDAAQKLRQRLDNLLEETQIDPARLAQEVALIADRCDVTEELVRLESHFSQFDETLRCDEPVGRKLDFLMQEMNREINTIGSKANDSKTASLVIRIKAEMEKMREQVQNVE